MRKLHPDNCVQRDINNLTVNCRNKEAYACRWNGALKDLEGHLVNCEKPVCCPNGCHGEIKTLRDNVEKLVDIAKKLDDNTDRLKGGLLKSNQSVKMLEQRLVQVERLLQIQTRQAKPPGAERQLATGDSKEGRIKFEVKYLSRLFQNRAVFERAESDPVIIHGFPWSIMVECHVKRKRKLDQQVCTNHLSILIGCDSPIEDPN